MSNRISTVVVIIAVLIISFGGGYTLGVYRNVHEQTPVTSTTEPSPDESDVLKLEAIEKVWDTIFSDYVDPAKINSANLSRAAIEGMIDALDDPYTSYMDPNLYEIGMTSFEGEFDGIGAYMTVREGRVAILAPISGSPAEKAGIEAGDIILEINGVSTDEMSVDEAIINIRGPKDTPVTLLVLHEGETEPVAITIIRATIEVPSVDLEMKGNIAHLSIYQFTERTDSELSDAISELKKEGATGIVLDLRDNPGGLLDSAIDVASRFIKSGLVTSVRSNQGVIQTYSVIPKLFSTDLPMLVLVNENSASASEVLTGALKDHDRAYVAGNVTYGKGSVNTLLELPDGSGLLITIARWLTPDGHLIEGQGIIPDKILDLTGDDAINWAIDYLEGQL